MSGLERSFAATRRRPQVLMDVQDLRKEAVLLGHYILACRFEDGWIPISYLCSIASIVSWFRKHEVAKHRNVEAMTDHILQIIRALSGTVGE